jgi:hypothetical protein
MSFILQALCGIIGLCILIPIVGTLSALISVNEENDALRDENERLRREKSRSSGGTSPPPS